jgi:hypothetical protein
VLTSTSIADKNHVADAGIHRVESGILAFVILSPVPLMGASMQQGQAPNSMAQEVFIHPWHDASP